MKNPSLSKIKLIRIIVLTGIAGLTLYYLWTHGVVYFQFAPKVYTEYFWFRAPWLLAHVICGITATLTGAFQFLPGIRAKYPGLHRSLGKIYMGCVAVSTVVSFYLVSTSRLGIVYAVGLTMLGITWSLTTGMAFVAIRNRRVAMHREWMIKSYVLTLSFVTFRFSEDMLIRMGISSFIERKVLMSWACWAIPFFFTVLVLDVRKLLRPAAREATEA
jgi:uncharacterized membrane protein